MTESEHRAIEEDGLIEKLNEAKRFMPDPEPGSYHDLACADTSAALTSNPEEVSLDAAAMLREFHDTFEIGDEERRAISLRLLSEEFAEVEVELQGWLADPSYFGQCLIARELADLTYVVYGTAQAFGIDLDAALREVHRANMSKIDTDGKPIKREDGKVLKGPNFTPPNMVVATTPLSEPEKPAPVGDLTNMVVGPGPDYCTPLADEPKTTWTEAEASKFDGENLDADDETDCVEVGGDGTYSISMTPTNDRFFGMSMKRADDETDCAEAAALKSQPSKGVTLEGVFHTELREQDWNPHARVPMVAGRSVTDFALAADGFDAVLEGKTVRLTITPINETPNPKEA